MTDKLNISALKAFADAITKDPSLLFSSELDFLRTALSQYGDLKQPASKGSCQHSGHSHEHGHEHDHGHHKAGHAHEHEAHHEEAVAAEEEEEEDPDRMAPEAEATLPVPAGGEGDAPVNMFNI